MPKEIILLTGDAEALHLENILRRHNQELKVSHARDGEELEAICSGEGNAGKRLLSFCSSSIVPIPILSSVMFPAYNFHPGPPTYPGSHVASFAIYDGADMFGVTAHEMAEKVDSGPIVAVDWFQIPKGMRFSELEIKAFEALVRLFMNLAPHLASNDAPLEHLEIGWAEKITTSKDFDKMQEIDENMSESEIRLRFRAFG